MNIVTVILAGGKGTRLQEETKGLIPKPLVEIGGKPIAEHIMDIYAGQGFKSFVFAAGFLMEKFVEYLSENIVNGDHEDRSICVVDTGDDSATAWRIAKINDKVYGIEPGCTFFLTYGDGVGNVDLKALLEVHKSSGALVTLTAVHPPGRFGMLDIEDGMVRSFREKPEQDVFINGGFMAVSHEIFEFMATAGLRRNTSFENDMLPLLAKAGKLGAYIHDGYWQMMDTPRDLRKLEKDHDGGSPWLKL